MTTERSGMSLDGAIATMAAMAYTKDAEGVVEAWEVIKAHLSRDAVVSTPPGYVLVPVEPTAAMVRAGACQISIRDSDTQGAVACWERMIANAPEAMLAQRDGGCSHEWIDATNSHVSGTAYCKKCGKLDSLENHPEVRNG